MLELDGRGTFGHSSPRLPPARGRPPAVGRSLGRHSPPLRYRQASAATPRSRRPTAPRPGCPNAGCAARRTATTSCESHGRGRGARDCRDPIESGGRSTSCGDYWGRRWFVFCYSALLTQPTPLALPFALPTNATPQGYLRTSSTSCATVGGRKWTAVMPAVRHAKTSGRSTEIERRIAAIPGRSSWQEATMWLSRAAEPGITPVPRSTHGVLDMARRPVLPSAMPLSTYGHGTGAGLSNMGTPSKTKARSEREREKNAATLPQREFGQGQPPRVHRSQQNTALSDPTA